MQHNIELKAKEKLLKGNEYVIHFYNKKDKQKPFFTYRTEFYNTAGWIAKALLNKENSFQNNIDGIIYDLFPNKSKADVVNDLTNFLETFPHTKKGEFFSIDSYKFIFDNLHYEQYLIQIKEINIEPEEKAIEEIQTAVAKHYAPLKLKVQYECYDYDANKLPKNNLQEVPIVSNFIIKYSLYGSTDFYYSPVLKSPTWLELIYYAECAIRWVGDEDHIFFEDIQLTEETHSDYPIAKLSMGS